MTGGTFGRKGIAGGMPAQRRAPTFGAAAAPARPLSAEDEMARRREAFLAEERGRNGPAPIPGVTDAQQRKIEKLVSALKPKPPETFDGKSYPLAFVLWMLFGVAGAHRLYLDRPVSGGIQAGLFAISFGLVAFGYFPAFLGLVLCTMWMLADGRLISRMSKARTKK